MDDVRGDFLGRPHGTTPAAVIAAMCLVCSNSSNVSKVCNVSCALFRCIFLNNLKNMIRGNGSWTIGALVKSFSAL